LIVGMAQLVWSDFNLKELRITPSVLDPVSVVSLVQPQMSHRELTRSRI
jgi:hypothetical protein